MFSIHTETDVTLGLPELTATVQASETQLLNDADLAPQFAFDPSAVDIDVDINQLSIGGVLGVLIEQLLGPFNFILADVVEFAVQIYVNDNTEQWSRGLLNLDIPAIPLASLGLDAASYEADGYRATFTRDNVMIEADGATVSYATGFEPTYFDPEVPDLGGIANTHTPVPLSPISGADDVSVLLSDDAVNQLLFALTQSGRFRTGFREQRSFADLLPADCSALPAGEGICAAIRGEPCNFPPSPDLLICHGAQAMLADRNISLHTPLVLYGQVTTAPKLFILGGSGSMLDARIRLTNFEIGVVADRDGDGVVNSDRNAVPSCINSNHATSGECALFSSCLDLTLDATLVLTESAGRLTAQIQAQSVALSNGTGCSGGVVTPGGAFLSSELTESAVLQAIQDELNGLPPLEVSGLGFPVTLPPLSPGGPSLRLILAELANLRFLVVENGDDPGFRDYSGATATLQVLGE